MKKNSIVKSFIKKVVSRSPRSASYSHVFFRLTSICLCLAVAVSAMAIPAYAANTEWVPITLTAEDLYNIYLDNSIVSAFYLTVIDGEVDLLGFDGSSTHLTSSDDPFSLFNFYPDNFPCFISEDVFYFFAPYLVVGPSGGSSSYTISSVVQFPFPYSFGIGDPSTFYIYSFCSTYSDQTEISVICNLNDDTVIASFTSSPFLNEPIKWDSNNPLYAIYSLFPDFQSTFRLYNDSYISTTEFSVTASGFHNLTLGSGVIHSGSTDEFNSQPLLFGISSMTVYVEQEISDPVQEYLDAIAGPPTAENQTKINNLKQKFDSIDSDLEQSAHDMEVEIPDISNKLDTLPQEVVQGNSMVSTNIYTPMLNIPFVTTIFTALFSFLALKLILHGGGKK